MLLKNRIHPNNHLSGLKPSWGAQIDASSDPSLSLFTVDGPTTTPLGPVTESTQGSWFVQGTCTNCENDCETVWDVEVPRRDYAAVKGDSLSLEWVEPIIWDARRNLYESLLMQPEIAEGRLINKVTNGEIRLRVNLNDKVRENLQKLNLLT